MAIKDNSAATGATGLTHERAHLAILSPEPRDDAEHPICELCLERRWQDARAGFTIAWCTSSPSSPGGWPSPRWPRRCSPKPARRTRWSSN